MTAEQIGKLFLKAKANWTYINNQSKEEIGIMLELWMEELKGCRFEDVSRALSEHMRQSGSFFPTIADLIKYSVTSSDEKTKQAVSKFRECIKRGGSLFVDDLYIVWTIKNIGGWDYCRRYEIEKIEWLVKSFESEYLAIVKRKLPENISNLLLANIHKRNAENELFFPVSTVGDEAKAKALYLECKETEEKCKSLLMICENTLT